MNHIPENNKYENQLSHLALLLLGNLLACKVTERGAGGLSSYQRRVYKRTSYCQVWATLSFDLEVKWQTNINCHE